MSKHRKQAKTQGLEWLVYSIMAFNGSGYADMNSAEDFLQSYITYKAMRKDNNATRLAQLYRVEILPTIEDLLDHTLGASRTPAPKAMKRFEQFKDQLLLLLCSFVL